MYGQATTSLQSPKEHQECIYVDTAGIGGKKMQLPGEVSKVTCSYMEKSAEVIVPTGNELHKTAQVSQVGKDRTQSFWKLRWEH